MRAILAGVAIAAMAGLSGCGAGGFTPLYATPGVTSNLQAVDITTPQNRLGFLLREQLNDQLSRKLDQPSRYRLDLTAEEIRSARGLRVNNVASDFELTLRVGYRLMETGGGAQPLLSGVAPVTVFYVSADAPYAGIAAQQDAQERAANQAAIQIRLDLSRYFNRLAANPAAKTP